MLRGAGMSAFKRTAQNDRFLGGDFDVGLLARAATFAIRTRKFYRAGEY